MPTLYSRLYKYCKENKVEMIPIEERAILGREVMDAFMRVKAPEKIIHYKSGIDNGEPYKVIDYPKNFKSVIDKYIDLYYKLR